jgi:2-C-methyl-D-erythritol 4-phosphate cytidylyltransferase
MEKIDCIILASGNGSRVKMLNYPKQFFRLGGKPLIVHILEKMRMVKDINKLIITCVPNTVNEVISIVELYGIKNYICVEGGSTRQESCKFGIEYVTTNRCMVHEGARPFLTVGFLNDLINTKGDVVVPYTKNIQTVYNEETGKYLNRDKVFQIQLPQVFDTNILKSAHNKAKQQLYNDDSSLVYGELKIKSKFINGLEENIKITTSLDLKIAEVIYEEIGSGNWRFDRDR